MQIHSVVKETLVVLEKVQKCADFMFENVSTEWYFFYHEYAWKLQAVEEEELYTDIVLSKKLKLVSPPSLTSWQHLLIQWISFWGPFMYIAARIFSFHVLL